MNHEGRHAFLVCFMFCITYFLIAIKKQPSFSQISLIRNTSHGERNVLRGKVSVVKKESESKSLNVSRCYWQVQIWKGSKKPQAPRTDECRGLKCGIRLVIDTSYETMKYSDAIVFYHTSHWNWKELQKRRPINQAWIFFSIEPPPLTKESVVPPLELDRIYNFTMSYRPSSSIHSPYGIYTPKPHIEGFKANRNWAEGKTGLVAWASSRCVGRGLRLQTWRRREFVETLAKHVSVDVYGNCGNISCERHSRECWRIIGSHKFYLALENSECRDYITEKFWVNALRYNMVPIVYGPPREDYERVAPPNSFIHLQDFNNFSELLDYINLLDSNDTLFNTYFKWREHGSIRSEGEGKVLRPPFYCKKVNTLLNNDNFSTEQNGKRQHPSIYDFWTKSCITPSGFPHDF